MAALCTCVSGVLILLTQQCALIGCQPPPLPRDEYTDNRLYYKVNVNLTEIPTDIPREAVNVDLQYNYITHIPGNVFSHLDQCEILSLIANQISTIEQGAFNGLVKIRDLDLRGNYITRIQADMFSDLSQCEKLSLWNNQISVIESGAFRGLVGIRDIYLDDNRLTELRSDMFLEPDTLQSLYLRSNQIVAITDDTFINLQNLKLLELGNNRIKTLTPRTFRGLDSLQELVLDVNDLTGITVGVFSELPRPLKLRLSRNPLTCGASLCWLKQEELQGSVTWDSDSAQTFNPECANSGVDWDTWVCTAQGKNSYSITTLDLQIF